MATASRTWRTGRCARRVSAWACALLLPLVAVVAAPAARAATVSFADVPVTSWRANGVGYAALLVGDHVYVGGIFTSVTSPDGATVAVRANLAAFSASTGALIGAFRADTDGAVRALADDGVNLYVGGSFTTVNGVSRGRLAALDPATGAVRSTWSANANSNVYGLSVGGGRLFVVGSFSTLHGAARSRVAAVDLASGTPSAFAPVSSTTVNTVSATSDGSAVYVGGTLSTLNGASVTGLARLDATGALVPVAWRSVSATVLGVEVSGDGSRLAVAMGGSGNQGAWYDSSTGTRLWHQTCDGDAQAAHVIDGSFFTGFHESCNGDATIRLTSNNLLTGVRDTTFRPSFDRYWGVRAIAGNDTALVVAGDFTVVSGVPVQGFAVFPAAAVPADTSAPTAPTGLQAAATGNGVALTWAAAQDDVGVAGYQVLRDGTAIASSVPGTSYLDATVRPGSTYRYAVRAFDAAGNLGPLSGPVSVTVPDGGAALFSETWTAADGSAWSPAWTTSSSNGVVDVQQQRGRLGLGSPSGGYARAVLAAVSTTDTTTALSNQWSATTPTTYFSLFTRSAGGWQNGYRPMTGYGIQLASSSGTVLVQRNLNGTLTTLATVPAAQSVTTARQRLRFVVSGQQIMFRVWPDGTPEPSAWAWTGSDSAVQAPGQLYVSATRGSTATGTVSATLDDLEIR